MQEKVLMKGNEAIAEAAILAGCRHYLGYPITPQTEVAAYMAKKMPKIGGTFLQAESEIAAINMVYGVAATGKRAMTSSSTQNARRKWPGQPKAVPGTRNRSSSVAFLQKATSSGSRDRGNR